MFILLAKLLHELSNLILTLSIYVFKFTRPKKEKHMHNLLIIPPRIFDFGAETINRNAAKIKSTDCLNEIENHALISFKETFGTPKN